MAKMKSKFISELLKPLYELVLRKHLVKSLANESHLHTGRMQLYLAGDEHDGLIRAIISLREFLNDDEKTWLYSYLHSMVDKIMFLSDEEYLKHINCYKQDGFLASTAIKKETLQSKKKK